MCETVPNHCYLADPAYGEGVTTAMGIEMSEIEAANSVEK